MQLWFLGSLYTASIWLILTGHLYMRQDLGGLEKMGRRGVCLISTQGDNKNVVCRLGIFE